MGGGAKGIKFVETLSRALRFQHDAADVFRVTPFAQDFGRERNVAGIPWQPVQEHSEVSNFFYSNGGPGQKSSGSHE